MLEGITPALLGDWGAKGLVSLIVLLVLLGILVPRWIHKERVNDKDQQIKYLQAALDKRDEQVDSLLDGHNLVVQLLQSIKQEAERRRG